MDNLFNTENLAKISKEIFDIESFFDLRSLNIDTFDIPSDYQLQDFIIVNQKNYPKLIRAVAEDISHKAEDIGCPPQVFTAIYESILNAYQHGNRKDPNKNIKIGRKLTKNSLEVCIVDEGGVIQSEFVPFIMAHYAGNYKNGFLDYYQFTNNKKNDNNQGKGTFFIFSYVDEVRYFKSPSGGLGIYLKKEFQSDSFK